MNYIGVIALTIVIFLALIMNLAAKPSFNARLTGSMIFMAVIGGLFFYGYGFATIYAENFPLAVIRAVLALCGMFVGKNELSAISAAPIYQWGFVVFCFWIVHLFALYATASAAITTVGARALRQLRLLLVRRGELIVIFGANKDAVSLGKQMLAKNHSLIFVDDQPDASAISVVNSMNAVLRTDQNALKANKHFFKSVGIRAGKRKVSLYAISKDVGRNLEFALEFMKTMESVHVAPEKVALTILGEEDLIGNTLQAVGEKYGFGSVYVFNEANLAARILIQNYPPCDVISFDENARAKEDFDALVIGFGKMGQAVLKNVIMHGQFEGSKFHAAVFAPNCEQVSGSFLCECREVPEHYDIEFHSADARSREMYAYLNIHRDTLKYIAICTGNERLNAEIEADLSGYLKRMQCGAKIYQCSYNGIVHTVEKGRPPQKKKLYSLDVLCQSKLDAMAMALNYRYCKTSGRSAVQEWAECDYFNRMSNRASADFVPALLKAAGKNWDEVVERGLNISAAALENLSRTEHLRWCAFHYVMGFERMPGTVYEERAEQYRKEKAAQGFSRLRLGKDMQNRQHACLISWEELDELSARECAVTGDKIDYKAMDTNNILAIPELLRISASL